MDKKSCRKVLDEKLPGVEFNAVVFGADEDEAPGKVALYMETAWYGGGGSAEVRTYCRAGDLRRLAKALEAAAADIETNEGA